MVAFWFRIYYDFIIRKTCNLKHVRRSMYGEALVNIDPGIDSTLKKKFHMNLLELDMDIIDQVIIVIPNE